MVSSDSSGGAVGLIVSSLHVDGRVTGGFSVELVDSSDKEGSVTFSVDGMSVVLVDIPNREKLRLTLKCRKSSRLKRI